MNREQIDEINQSLAQLERNPSLVAAQEVTRLLLKHSIGINGATFQLFNDSSGKIRASASLFESDRIVEDKKAAYSVSAPAVPEKLEIKLYGIRPSSKATRSWITGLTNNWEDLDALAAYPAGMDFIYQSGTPAIEILSTFRRSARSLTLQGRLSNTDVEVLTRWSQIKFLDTAEKIHEVLWSSLDLQPLGREFYKGIVSHFLKLVDHLQESGYKKTDSEQFSSRLLGRILFCWFLNEMEIINSDADYFELDPTLTDCDYYARKLEILFYEILNKPDNIRTEDAGGTPYLNGGLFEPHLNDFYLDAKLSFPIGFFTDLYEFLRRFNFTTDESTADYQERSIDPEMLGRIFENLLAHIVGTTGTKQSEMGTYYTPREVVDHMCRHALKKYLTQRVKDFGDFQQRLWQLIDASDQEFFDQDHNWRREFARYKNQIIASIEELRILDPACGSGAFPIGMLQLLLRVYDRLSPGHDRYQAKLKIIETMLFGSDIEPMAVEISRLRAWLSLIVDAPDKHNVHPLPNLEFNFVAANSLRDLGRKGHGVFGEDLDLENKLAKLKHNYFSSNDYDKKKALKLKYRALVGPGLGHAYSYEEQLKSFDPFDVRFPARFLDPKFMFGVDLFGIVIGNPPYGASVNDDERAFYKQRYDSCQSKNGKKGSTNTFVAFIERGMELLEPSGVLSFIVPMSVVSSEQCERLHDYLRNNSKLTSFASFADRPRQVFDNAAVNVTILETVLKSQSSDDSEFYSTALLRRRDGVGLVQLLDKINFVDSSRHYLKGRFPKIGTQWENEMLDRLRGQPLTIKDFVTTDDSHDNVYYRSAGGRYFKVITTRPTGSSAEKTLKVKKGFGDFVAALMSSNLFFWWYQIYSDNLNLKLEEILSFPVPRIDLGDTKWQEVATAFTDYSLDIEANKQRRVSANYAHVDSFDNYRIGRSKAKIDLIDGCLFPLYNLDVEQLKNVVNYEIDVRLSQEE